MHAPLFPSFFAPSVYFHMHKNIDHSRYLCGLKNQIAIDPPDFARTEKGEALETTFMHSHHLY